jgi:hypothetical protein
VVWRYRRGYETSSTSVRARTDAEVEVLKAVAAQRMAARQDELPIGVPAKQRAESLEITSSWKCRMLDILCVGLPAARVR